MASATLLPTDLSIWAATTRHYHLDDDTWVLVEVDESGPSAAMQAYVEQVIDNPPQELVPRPMNFIKRPTVILPADAEGFATSLDPLYTFEAGTSHNDALTGAGHELA